MSALTSIKSTPGESLSFRQSNANRHLKMLFFVAAAILPAIHVDAAGVRSRVGLDGYDPTVVINDHELVKGKSARSAEFDGVTYHFVSRESRNQFLKSPQKYVPAFGGDCTVCYAKSGERVPGSIQYSSLHNERLFLFPGKAAKAEFLRNSHLYENTDLVAGGNSVVWLLRGQRRLSGSPRFSETYRGLRYHFASIHDQFEFRRNRARYANLIMKVPQHLVTKILQSGAEEPSTMGTVNTESAAEAPTLTAEMAYLEPPRPPISIN